MNIELALWWLFLNLVSTAILAFFSMSEMACVSLNKIRLHYYVSKGYRRAIWLNTLIQNPTKLFGTTLLGVNVAMFFGSEFARQFYLSLGLNPGIAPLTQVAFIIIFAELAPMFAARRYAEHVAFLSAPVLYFTSKVISPLLWTINSISYLLDFFIFTAGKKHDHISFNQEDLQKILSIQGEEQEGEGDEFGAISANLFRLRHKDAKSIMEKITFQTAISSQATVEQVRIFINKPDLTNLLVYERDMHNIIGIVHPRDLIRVPDSRKVKEYISPPWFITQNAKLLQILKDFRHNKKNIAIVLNEKGLAAGMISLENLTEEIFGKITEDIVDEVKEPSFILDRTFSGNMTVEEFNNTFDILLDEDETITLSDLMKKILGHDPEEGEKVFIPPFELTVEEVSLTGAQKISIISL